MALIFARLARNFIKIGYFLTRTDSSVPAINALGVTPGPGYGDIVTIRWEGSR